MSDGVFISDRPQLAIARQTVSFASLGLNDPTLTRIIYEVGNPYLSYVPTDEFNPIAGITEGKSYLLYLNSFFDGSPALANAVLTNLIPQTSTNVFAGVRVVFLCTASVSFATAGINTTNTNLITLVSEGYFTSYDPNDSINGIDGFVEGELYDIDPITDIDLHLYGVTKIRYSDEVLYLDSLEDVVVTNSNPDATLPLAEEEVLIRNITTGVWENKPVSDLPTGTSYTDEQAQDAVGTILADTDTIDFTYNDATPSIIADVKKQMSIVSDASGLKLSGDSATPGNSKYYGTDSGGSKGFYTLPSGGGAGTSGVAVYTSSNYTIAANDTHVITESIGGLTVTLPSAATYPGRVIWITNQGIANHTLTPAVKYNSVSTANVLPTGVAWAIISDGTNWWRLNAAEQYSVLDATITGLSLIAAGGHVTAAGTRNTTLRSLKAGAGALVSLSTNDIIISSSGVASKTAAYTATTSDFTITGDATSGAFSVTLPTAVGNTGKIFTIKKIDSSGNAVTVATTSAQTIDGAASYSLASQWKYVVVESTGANWIIIGNN